MDKKELLSRIAGTRAELEGVVGRLRPEDFLRQPPGGGWTPKDHLAHVAAWDRRSLALLEGRPTHEVFGLDEAGNWPGIDAVNERVRARHEDWSVDQVLNLFQEAHENLRAVLEAVSPERLEETYLDYRIVEAIIDDTFEHYPEHREAIEAILGERGR